MVVCDPTRAPLLVSSWLRLTGFLFGRGINPRLVPIVQFLTLSRVTCLVQCPTVLVGLGVSKPRSRCCSLVSCLRSAGHGSRVCSSAGSHCWGQAVRGLGGSHFEGQVLVLDCLHCVIFVSIFVIAPLVLVVTEASGSLFAFLLWKTGKSHKV